jgi:hypothetical protein
MADGRICYLAPSFRPNPKNVILSVAAAREPRPQRTPAATEGSVAEARTSLEVVARDSALHGPWCGTADDVAASASDPSAAAKHRCRRRSRAAAALRMTFVRGGLNMTNDALQRIYVTVAVGVREGGLCAVVAASSLA